MNIKADNPIIAVLRNLVEERFGKRLMVHSDFLALVSEIETMQRQHISESTLERVWGYSTRGYTSISLHTLDVLSHYAKQCDWVTLCQAIDEEAECESELFNTDCISSHELNIGDSLQIGWKPNRLCTVEYLGDNRFVATHCQNSKMQAGDTFTCLQFTLGKPLVMHDLCRSGNTSHTQTYVVGRQNGLTILKRK